VSARRRNDEASELLAQSDASLLDLVDHVLNKGVVLQGEAILGVAGVDLVYLRLSAILCTVDRIMPSGRAFARPTSGKAS
jgi:hypothetical protein